MLALSSRSFSISATPVRDSSVASRYALLTTTPDAWHKSWLVVVKGFTPTLRLKLLYVFDAPMRALLQQALLTARYFWEVESKSDAKRASWKFWQRDSTSDSASWKRDSAISRRIYEQHNVCDIPCVVPAMRRAAD